MENETPKISDGSSPLEKPAWRQREGFPDEPQPKTETQPAQETSGEELRAQEDLREAQQSNGYPATEADSHH